MALEKLLSKHQSNKLGILRDLLTRARWRYIEAIERYMRIFNNEPNIDNGRPALFNYDVWRHKLDNARIDMVKMFSEYNKAFNSYTSYYSVCYGG